MPRASSSRPTGSTSTGPFAGGSAMAMEVTEEERQATYESLWGEGGFRISASSCFCQS